MLHHITHIPENVRPGAPVLILLHGRGSNELDMLGLQRHLPADVVVLAPRAPFDAAPWGYGPGWAWYRFLGGNRPEPESFDRSQEELVELVRRVPELVPVTPGPVVVGGFSQGGTMSLGFAFRNPGLVSGILNLSGFLPDHPSVRPEAEALPGTRIFWGHGTADPSVPFSLAVEGRAALAGTGARLEARDYQIGHGIAPKEISDVVTWLSGLAGGAAETMPRAREG